MQNNKYRSFGLLVIEQTEFFVYFLCSIFVTYWQILPRDWNEEGIFLDLEIILDCFKNDRWFWVAIGHGTDTEGTAPNLSIGFFLEDPTNGGHTSLEAKCAVHILAFFTSSISSTKPQALNQKLRILSSLGNLKNYWIYRQRKSIVISLTYAEQYHTFSLFVCSCINNILSSCPELIYFKLYVPLMNIIWIIKRYNINYKYEN